MKPMLFVSILRCWVTGVQEREALCVSSCKGYHVRATNLVSHHFCFYAHHSQWNKRIFNKGMQ